MANITVSDLYINSKNAHPRVEGWISLRKIWSANTGRTAAGKMVGTVVAVKTTIKIKWPPLTPDQVAVIESAVSDGDNPFVPVKFTDATGVTVTKTMYFGKAHLYGLFLGQWAAVFVTGR